MKRFFYWLTGGRPMQHVCPMFTDVVSGKQVHMWTDAHGNRWMASGSWSLFRVETRHGPEIWS